METSRARPGLATAPATLAGVRQMMRALRRGETVGLLPDQVPPDGMGVWAPFFGRPAYTMTLAARLVAADRRRAAADGGERLPRGAGYHVHALPLPEPLPHGSAADEAHQRACAHVINRAMESLIRRCPQQYLWGYNRYKPPREAVAGVACDGLRGVARVCCSRLLWLLQLAAAARCRRRSAARSAAAATRWRARAGASRVRNLELCFPELGRRRAARAGARALPLARPQPARARPAVVRAARAAEAPDPRRGRRRLAERSERPVMWLVPHFMALDVAGVAMQLFQSRPGASIYQAQSNPVFDAAMRRGRAALRRRGDLPAQRSGAAADARDQQRPRLLQPAGHGLRRARRRLRAVLRRAGGDAAGAVAHGARAATWWCSRWWPRCCPAARATACASCRRGTTSRATTPLADALRMNQLDRRRDPAQPGAVPVGAQALQDAAAGRTPRCVLARPDGAMTRRPIIAP